MLRPFIALWKAHSFMKRIVGEFEGMLTDAEYVFTNAWNVLTGEVPVKQVQQSLYARDRAVNRHERELRRIVLEHLSFNPGQDVSGCLAMMSLVKDAERIGDYSKNIFDLAVMLKGEVADIKYLDRLSATRKKIADHFPELKEAFLESDEQKARHILLEYLSIKEECNEILRDLLSEDMPPRQAVATALLSRYLKRINSHMSNIASGIVYPLDQIDFVRGDLLE